MIIEIMNKVLKELDFNTRDFAIKNQKKYKELISKQISSIKSLIEEKKEYDEKIKKFDKDIAGKEKHPEYNEYKIKIKSLTKRINKEEEKALKELPDKIRKFIESDYFFNNINNEIRKLTNLTVNQVNNLPYDLSVKRLLLRRISNKPLTKYKINNQTISLSNLKKEIKEKIKRLKNNDEIVYYNLKALASIELKRIISEAENNIKKIIKEQERVMSKAVMISKDYNISLNKVLSLFDKGLTKEKIVYLIKKSYQNKKFNELGIKKALTRNDEEAIRRLITQGKSIKEIEKTRNDLARRSEERLKMIDELSRIADKTISNSRLLLKGVKALKENLEGFNNWVSS